MDAETRKKIEAKVVARLKKALEVGSGFRFKEETMIKLGTNWGAEAMEEIMREREAKLVAERDAYALAMKVALEDGIFTHKSATKAKIQKLLQPFLAEHHAAKGEG